MKQLAGLPEAGNHQHTGTSHVEAVVGGGDPLTEPSKSGNGRCETARFHLENEDEDEYRLVTQDCLWITHDSCSPGK